MTKASRAREALFFAVVGGFARNTERRRNSQFWTFQGGNQGGKEKGRTTGAGSGIL
jgi:hypothetical protein